MTVINIDALPVRGVLIGLDVGRARVGVAISDSGQRIASPITTLERKSTSALLANLIALYDLRGCSGVIAGTPLNMDGSQGPQARSVRAFCNHLLNHRAMPLALWDERLSSRAAERSLLEADTSRKKRAKRIDAIAACVILQTALDYLNGSRSKAR